MVATQRPWMRPNFKELHTTMSSTVPPKRPRTEEAQDSERSPSLQFSPGDPRRYFSLCYDSRRHSCVMALPNGIAVISLAPLHPILAKRLTVSTVDFKVLMIHEKTWLQLMHACFQASGTDLLENETSGKKKRGALAVDKLHPTASTSQHEFIRCDFEPGACRFHCLSYSMFQRGES